MYTRSVCQSDNRLLRRVMRSQPPQPRSLLPIVFNSILYFDVAACIVSSADSKRFGPHSLLLAPLLPTPHRAHCVRSHEHLSGCFSRVSPMSLVMLAKTSREMFIEITHNARNVNVNSAMGKQRADAGQTITEVHRKTTSKTHKMEVERRWNSDPFVAVAQSHYSPQ